jgi:hypothetical protein
MQWVGTWMGDKCGVQWSGANLVTGQEAYPLQKDQTRLLGVQEVTPWSERPCTGITVQSSQWFPNPDETGPLSLIGKDWNSIQKSDDQNSKVMNSCFHLRINWKRLLCEPTAVFRWLVSTYWQIFIGLLSLFWRNKSRLMRLPCYLYPPNFFDFYVVRVTSEGSRQLVLPWTSCFLFWY